MYYFCTLFDSNYLSRGLAMYESLRSTSIPFQLYIFAFDEKCREILSELKLAQITVISLSDFEDEKLLAIKKERTRAEYCWTCSSLTIEFCLKNFKIDHCTYVDADLYFFSSPALLIDNLKQDSVSIIAHRYSPQYKYYEVNGIYCVQFMTFKNDANGMNVLKWWTESCIEWCYDRNEDGKYGDQKYLDDWLVKFSGIQEIKDIGAGVAPWNVQQYYVSKSDSELKITEKKNGFKSGLIFYHFHNFRFMRNDMFDFGFYVLDKRIIDLIYKPYLIHLESMMKKISVIDSKINPHGLYNPVFYWKTPFTYLKRKLLGTYNVFSRSQLMMDTK